MNITRENYEAYIIDYLDGKLNPVQSAELMNFLSQNPDLEEEFNEFENIKINSSKDMKLNKDALKRNFSDIEQINDENFDEFCVANFEGDLNNQNEIRLKEYLKKHPEKQKDFNLFSKIYLSPDYSIRYPGKNDIKKISPFIRRKNLLMYATSVAAAILVLILLVYMPGKDRGRISEIQVADNITEENISSQQEYENNVEVAEKMITKEKKYIVLENIKNNQITEKKSVNLPRDKNNKYKEREIPEYLTPISPQIIARVENADLMMYEDINTTGNLYANKYLLDKTAEKDEETERYISIYGINISKIDIWRLAEAGIKGFNYLTESELLLSKKMSKDGEVVAFALNSETFSISSPLKK
jgi:hypothetical protein